MVKKLLLSVSFCALLVAHTSYAQSTGNPAGGLPLFTGTTPSVGNLNTIVNYINNALGYTGTLSLNPGGTNGQLQYNNNNTFGGLNVGTGLSITAGSLVATGSSTAVPAGTNGQIQYNNSGVSAGFTAGGDLSLVPSTGVFTVTKTNGTAFGTAATQNTGTSGATIPLLNGTNTWSANNTFSTNTTLGTTTFSGITGSTQCLHVSSSGVISGTGSDCGSGGGLSSIGAYSVLANNTGSSAVPIGTTSLILGTAPSFINSSAVAQFTMNTNGYSGVVVQNTSTGSAASAEVSAQNNLGTTSTYYMSMGQNSSFYSGTGSINLANAGYLEVDHGDMVLDTNTNNKIHFEIANAAADVVTIGSNSVTVNQPMTLGNITGSTQCLQVSSTGVISGTGSACGSGGGAVNSVANSDGTLTISPTTGTVVASIALGHANTWTANQTFPAGSISDSVLATQAASTILANPTGSSASPQAVTLGNNLVFNSTTLGVTVPDTTKTANYTVAAADMGGQINFNGTGLTVTIPAISGTVFANGQSLLITNRNTTNAVTISSTPTINGYSGTSIPPLGGLYCASNGTSLDCVGSGAALGGSQTANTVLGALTATTASGLSVPSCSGASNALTWTSGTGFGCNTISGGGAVSSVSNSDGTLTISPTTGAVVASLNLGHANTWTNNQTISAVTVNGNVYYGPLTNGEGEFAGTTSNGALITGYGSTNDITIWNKSAATVCSVATGTTTLNCAGIQLGGTNLGTAATVNTGTTSGTIPTLGTGGILANAQMQGNIGIEIDFDYTGVPTASAHLNKTFSRQTVIPASAAIKCSAQEGATSSATVTLYHVVSGTPTSVGTLVFGASGSAYQSCTATFSSAVTFAVGDSLTAVFPSTADATLGDIAISIPATQ